MTKIVGTSPLREDARVKIDGAAKYVDDLSFPGMAYAMLVRSPFPHAKISEIDASHALELPEVVAVITAKDIPGKNKIPIVFDDQPCLAEDEARYIGEPVAIVVANDRRTAQIAATLVSVKYSELPAITDPLLSLAEGAEKVNPVLGNILSRHKVNKGDVDSAMSIADVVVEGEYKTGYQEHAYIETQGVIAVPENEGGIALYGSMQCPFYIHKALGYVLGIPLSKLRVIQTVTGGAFGGKEDFPSLPATHAAIAAYLTSRPVKLVMTREEDILCSTKRHPGIVRIKYGARRDGTIIACDAEYILNAGAWSTLSPIVLWRGTVHSGGPYRIENFRVDAKAVATNSVPNGAFRGFGQPQVCFANESLIDELAVKLGMDPVELRLRNALDIGLETLTNHVIKESCGLKKVISLVRDEVKWLENRSRKERVLSNGKYYGVGFSAAFYGTGLGAGGKKIDRSGAFLQVAFDGSVQIAVGTTEMGQGHNTVLSMIAAEELGADVKKVSMLPIDTSRVPDSGPTVASRATMMSGQAIRDAAKQVRKIIHDVVAKRLGAAVETLEFEPGVIFSGAKKITFEEAVTWCFDERVHLAAQGWFKAPNTEWNSENGLGDAYYAYTYTAIGAEVAVDKETGEVEVLRIVSGHDIGKAINRREVEGQIQGGAVQGMGYALYEDLVSTNGKIIRPNFSGYIIPTAADIPEIKPVIVEEPYEGGPFGAKGLGEPPLIAIAPAIANAIFDAIGVRIKKLPMTPERILETLEAVR